MSGTITIPRQDFYITYLFAGLSAQSISLNKTTTHRFTLKCPSKKNYKMCQKMLTTFEIDALLLKCK